MGHLQHAGRVINVRKVRDYIHSPYTQSARTLLKSAALPEVLTGVFAPCR